MYENKAACVMHYNLQPLPQRGQRQQQQQTTSCRGDSDSSSRNPPPVAASAGAGAGAAPIDAPRRCDRVKGTKYRVATGSVGIWTCDPAAPHTLDAHTHNRPTHAATHTPPHTHRRTHAPPHITMVGFSLRFLGGGGVFDVHRGSTVL